MTKCPKCHAESGDDWSQCKGSCPMPGSPHYERRAYASEETIVAAAIRVGKMTISAPPPARHHTLLHAFWNYNRKTVVGPNDQGFLTSTGRYVGREEAVKIAIAAAQIIKPQFQPHQLFSEDLW